MSNIIKLTLVMASIGAILFFTIPHASSGDYVSNFEKIPAVQNRPPQVASWRRTPTIIICDCAPVTEKQIDSAVDVWKNLGYRFFRTQYHYDPLDKCKSAAPLGYIVVRLIHQDIKMDDDDLAETHFYINNNHDEIEWAIVYMKPNVRETVLEHELGHTLGFLHFNKINHLMNSKWTQGGWDTNGLKNRR